MRVLLLQLAEATATHKGLSPERERDTINFCLPVIQGINPQDAFEVMLASQMAIAHNSLTGCTLADIFIAARGGP